MTGLVVVGAGGHGREVLDTVAAVNAGSGDMVWDVLGVVDDAPSHPERLARLRVPLLGSVDWLASRGGAFALGVGTPDARRRLAERLDQPGLSPASLVHPGVHVGSDVRLGTGVVVFNACTITTNVTIGDHTHLNVGCAVQHDTVVGSFVQFSPGVFVNGDCVIDDDVFLGTGAIVTRGCQVGAGARVGAGAVVLEDVVPGSTVVGVPARALDPPPTS